MSAAPAGDVIDVSPIMGKGFPTQTLPPEQFPYLFIFATGTGIAPIKALIESGDLQVGAIICVVHDLMSQPGHSMSSSVSVVCRLARGSSHVCTTGHSTQRAQPTRSLCQSGRQQALRWH
jgi:ferredoxin-NADP reductase